MKILHLITQGTWGGAQRYVHDIIGDSKNLHTHILAVGSPHEAKDLQQTHPECYQLQHLVRHISLWHDVLALWEIRQLYIQTSPDIVHLNSTKAGILGSIAAQLLSKKRRPRIFYTVHGWIFMESLPQWKKNLYLFLEQWTARYKDCIITTSPQEQHIAHTTVGILPSQCITIPIGIDQIMFKEKTVAQNILGIPTTYEQQYIGCIANHYPTKGIQTLLEAIYKSKELQQRTHLFLIGDGPEKEALMSYVTKHNLSSCVTFLGSVTNAAMYIQAFDLMVLPSHKEGLPYALLEIQQSGIPVIATTVGGIPSIITHQKTGILCKPHDSQSLTEAILYALNHPNNMQAYAHAAKEKQNKYNIHTMRHAINTLYTQQKTSE